MSRYRGRQDRSHGLPKRLGHYRPDEEMDSVMQLYEEATAGRRTGEDRPQGKVPSGEEKKLGEKRQEMREQMETVFIAMEEGMRSRTLDRNIILDAFCRTTVRTRRVSQVFGDLMAGQLIRPEIDKLKTVAVALFKTDVIEQKTGVYFNTLLGVMESITGKEGDSPDQMREEANNAAAQVLYAKWPRQVSGRLQELRQKHR